MEIYYSIALFVILWVFISKLCSVMGGWHVLAEKYRDTQQNKALLKKISMQSMKFKQWVTYGNCINVFIYEDGIVISPMLLFKLFHEPLFIPFNRINIEIITTSTFPKAVFLVEGIRITLRGSSVKYLKQQSL